MFVLQLLATFRLHSRHEAADCIAALYEGSWPGPAVVNPDVQASWSW